MRENDPASSGRLAAIRAPFEQRIRASLFVSWLAYRASRTGLFVTLALLPGLLLAAAVFWGPEAAADTLVDPDNVHEAFSRLAAVIATVSAISVSVAALTLRRELRGVGTVRQHHEVDLGYREDVRSVLERRDLPLGIAGFLMSLLEGVQASVRRVHASLRDLPEEPRVQGVRLGEFMDALDGSAHRMRAGLERKGKHPGWLLDHVFDVELRTTESLVRSFLRAHEASDELHDALEELRGRVEMLVTGVQYTKTLTMEWELSRMSFAILLTAFPGLVLTMLLVLVYDSWTVSLLGVGGAGLLVSASFAVAFLPLTAFGSHLLRIVFLNKYALPTAGFGLGPEEPDSFRHEISRERGRGAGGGSA